MKESAMSDERGPTSLITGDIVVDHHLYVGQRWRASDGGLPGTVEFVEFGGAALVERLLVPEQDENPVPWHAVLGLVKDPKLYPHCYAVWRRSELPSGSRATAQWRATLELGYGAWRSGNPSDAPPVVEETAEPVPAGLCAQIEPSAPETPDILIIDDAGAGFRNTDACWPRCLARDGKTPRWIVLKMSGELDGGRLWQQMATSELVLERTILVVTAADLRRAGHRISRGLSWERTALDAARVLRTVKGGPLAAARHVVVSFESAGALWADRSGAELRCGLVFDACSMEGDSGAAEKGKVFGFQSCLTAGIAWALGSALAPAAPQVVERDMLLSGVRRGLTARRVLHTHGHTAGPDGVPRGFPARRIREKAFREPPQSFTHVEVPAVTGPEQWTILGEAARGCGVSGPLYAEARLVALNGLSALAGTPSLQVGKFATVDRREIESLRRIQQLVREYEGVSPQDRPLSIAVFGAPGAGKSFLVKQLATASLGGETPFLPINLSQFYDEKELIGAFHRVRDVVLEGRTPFVLWDEFDSQEYRWLRLLLAPMQDGTFQEGQIVHPIGKCIFVFAGGTSATFSKFGPQSSLGDAEAARASRVWRFAKGPDFVSRLNGHLDVLGPNQRQMEPTGRGARPEPDDSDVCFPIRRALFLHAIVNAEHSSHPPIAPEVLDALLRVPKYTYGSRSYERILRILARFEPPWAKEALLSRDDLERDICEQGAPTSPPEEEHS